MQLFIPRESNEWEHRVAATPDSVQALSSLGFSVVVESGAGERSSFTDEAYTQAGATVTTDPGTTLAGADIVFRVNPPSEDAIGRSKAGSLHVGFLDPFQRPELANAAAARGLVAVSMEMMPRTTRAQKMDALSSQHSLAGYAMVIHASDRLGKAFPMMVTPSGTIQPARVFVIGAGVAGLQAIATARRLGARIEAFDTRPATKEQVQSLGAKFVDVDLGDTGETAGGYAKELTPEQKARQQEAMAKRCAEADVVITTAQVFGRPAPRIIDRKILDTMKQGALVIDYAVSTGGNVEGSVAGEEVRVGPARVLGLQSFPSLVASDASRMYASNLLAFIKEFWDAETRTLNLDMSDELLASAVVARDGALAGKASELLGGAS